MARLGEVEDLIIRLMDDNQKLHSKIDILQGFVNNVICRKLGIPSANGQPAGSTAVVGKGAP